MKYYISQGYTLIQIAEKLNIKNPRSNKFRGFIFTLLERFLVVFALLLAFLLFPLRLLLLLL